MAVAGIPVRDCAIGVDGGAVRVTFRAGSVEDEYLMAKATYDAISRGTVATVEDFRLHGEVLGPLNVLVWAGGHCACGRAATREVFPHLDADDGTYLVCDDDACITTPPADVASIEAY